MMSSMISLHFEWDKRKDVCHKRQIIPFIDSVITNLMKLSISSEFSNKLNRLCINSYFIMSAGCLISKELKNLITKLI